MKFTNKKFTDEINKQKCTKRNSKTKCEEINLHKNLQKNNLQKLKKYKIGSAGLKSNNQSTIQYKKCRVLGKTGNSAYQVTLVTVVVHSISLYYAVTKYISTL